MKRTLHRLALNPVFRIAALALAVALGVSVWNFWKNPDRTAYKATVVPLPQELGAHFAFSPSGDAVAGCTDNNQLAVTFLSMSSEGAAVKLSRVLPLPPNALCAPFIWSPDGKQLLMPRVIGSMEGSAAGFLLFKPEKPQETEFIRLPGGVDPNLLMSWSPDGKMVAYIAGVRTRQLGGLWLFNLPKRTARQLVLGVIQSPTFSLKGDRLYFAEDVALVPHAQYDAERDDWPHVWGLGSVSVSGGKPTYHAKWNQGSLMPPNDRLLAAVNGGMRYIRYFRALAGEKVELWEQPEAGQTRRIQTIQMEAKHLNRGVRWSKDGQRILFVDYVAAAAPNRLQFMDVATGRRETVIDGAGAVNNQPQKEEVIGRSWEDPAISPDGLWGVSTRSWVTLGVEADEGAGHDEDEGPTPKVDETTAKPYLLRLPPLP